MPGFLLDTDDEQAAEAHSETCWTLARLLAAEHPSLEWPPLPLSVPDDLAATVRLALNEVYFYGLLYAAAEAVILAGRDGVSLTLPPLNGTDGLGASRRHISWETLLPLDASSAAALALSYRLHGLARICEAQATSDNS